MNATICGIVDLLFKDTVDNAETRALREELLNNCLEHYNDLIDRGLTETEAIDAVVESLKGMKEVIDEYPKKQQDTVVAEESVEKTEIPESESSAEEENSLNECDRTFDTAMICKIRSDLRDADIHIGRSQDRLIHLRCENPEKINCEIAGSLLRISHASGTQNNQSEIKLKAEDISIKGILSFVGKAISKGFSSIGADGTTVYLDLPDLILDEMVLNSMSGNIWVNHCSAKHMILHSTSGDIDIQGDPEGNAERLNAGSSSGDVTYRGNAGRVEMTSISGDVGLEGSFLSVRLKSTSGDVHLTGCAQDAVARTVSGDQEIFLKNADAVAIDAGSTSGDIEIHVPKSVTGVHTIIQTVSGDRICTVPDSGSSAGLQIHAKTVSGDIKVI